MITEKNKKGFFLHADCIVYVGMMSPKVNSLFMLQSLSLCFLLPKSEISSLKPSSVVVQTGVSDQVGNPKDRFSHKEALLLLRYKEPGSSRNVVGSARLQHGN